MCSLKGRLLAVEDDYLHALAEGEHAVVAFGERWELLMADMNAALEANDLDEETASLAHATVTRISTLVDTSIDIYSLYNVHTSELVAEVNSLMSQLSLTDPNPTPSIESPLSLAISIPRSKVERKSSARKRVWDAGDTSEDSGSDSRKRHRTDTETSPRFNKTSSNISQPIQQSCFTSRKRRLSEGDSSPSLIPPSKRLHVGPRLHAVSDSFAGLEGRRSVAQPHLAYSSSDNLPATPRRSSTSLPTFHIRPAIVHSGTNEVVVGLDVLPVDQGTGLAYPSFLSNPPTSCASPALDPTLYQPGGDLTFPVSSITDLLYGSFSDSFPSSPDSTLSTPSSRSTPMTPTPSEDWILPPLLFEVDSRPHPSDHHSSHSLQPAGAKYPSGFQSVTVCSPGDVTRSLVEESGIALDWDALFGSLDPSVWLSLPPPPHWQFDDASLSSNTGSDLLAALSSPIDRGACRLNQTLKLDVAQESCGVLA